MAISLSDEKITVVMVGSFDPDLARPQRLVEQGVIRQADLETLEFRSLLQGQITEFSLVWCSISVTRDRFAVESKRPPYVKIADLVLKTLRELMPTATVSMFGINSCYKMNFSNRKARDDFGTRLVPPETWGNWGEGISNQIANFEGTDEQLHGGVYQVTMREQPIEGRESGWRDMQILSNTLQTASHPGGTALIVNDHFQLDLTKHPEGINASETARRRTNALLEILADQFQSSLDTAESLAKDLINKST